MTFYVLDNGIKKTPLSCYVLESGIKKSIRSAFRLINGEKKLVFSQFTIYYQIEFETFALAEYGCCYPVTYEFSLPVGANDCNAYIQQIDGGAWNPIPEFTTTDFFNGITAVRFDYVNNRAYVSASPDGQSPYFRIAFIDSMLGDITQNTTFLSTSSYYDNRSCAVVLTADDYNDALMSHFSDMANYCRDRQLWITFGVITGSVSASGISALNDMIALGGVEPGSHSIDHIHDCDAQQIYGSRDWLKNNIAFPQQQIRGSDSFLWSWIRPFGDAPLNMADLVTYRFLADRTVNITTVWPNWNVLGDNGLFSPINLSGAVSYDRFSNAGFDQVYNQGGVYLLMSHPGGWEQPIFSENTAFQAHLDYIGNRNDVWYVGMGHLSAYKYATEQNVITVTKTGV